MSLLNLLHRDPKMHYYISIECDNWYSHRSDVTPVIRKAVEDLRKLDNVKISEEMTHTSQNTNGKYSMITDVFYYHITFPASEQSNVDELLNQYPLLRKTEEKPRFLPSMGPGITKPTHHK